MYFPYLRGKQFDLLAIADCAATIAKDSRVIPIIEPVKSNADSLVRVVGYCSEESAPLILIVNPQVGDLAKDPSPIRTMISSKKLLLGAESILGYVVSRRTTAPAIRSFLGQYAKSNVAFIHQYSFSNPEDVKKLFDNHQNIKYQVFIEGTTGQAYQRVFRDYNRVLIRDGFNKMVKNADYVPDEFFSDLHHTYQDLGMHGFGDYGPIGKDFYDKGGPAYAVAIHLTYQRDGADVWIKHFVSDRTSTKVDIAGKFMEALEKLIYFLDKNPEVDGCSACKQFRDYYLAMHFPQLGPVKRLSIVHHIDLMNRLLG